MPDPCNASSAVFLLGDATVVCLTKKAQHNTFSSIDNALTTSTLSRHKLPLTSAKLHLSRS